MGSVVYHGTRRELDHGEAEAGICKARKGRKKVEKEAVGSARQVGRS